MLSVLKLSFAILVPFFYGIYFCAIPFSNLPAAGRATGGETGKLRIKSRHITDIVGSSSGSLVLAALLDSLCFHMAHAQDSTEETLKTWFFIWLNDVIRRLTHQIFIINLIFVFDMDLSHGGRIIEALESGLGFKSFAFNYPSKKGISSSCLPSFELSGVQPFSFANYLPLLTMILFFKKLPPSDKWF